MSLSFHKTSYKAGVVDLTGVEPVSKNTIYYQSLRRSVISAQFSSDFSALGTTRYPIRLVRFLTAPPPCFLPGR